MSKKVKVLYFEGAGCDWTKRNDVDNCRIRTAFTNKEGKKIYVELSGFETRDKKGNTTTKGYVDSLHYITSDPKIDDCNNSRLKIEGHELVYTKEGMLNFINQECNCNFTEIKILNTMGGYRVFKKEHDKIDEQKNYNYGDNFIYDAELEQKRLAKKEELSNKFKEEFNQKYDNTSIWCDYENNNILHISINVEEEKRLKAGYKERYFDIAL